MVLCWLFIKNNWMLGVLEFHEVLASHVCDLGPLILCHSALHTEAQQSWLGLWVGSTVNVVLSTGTFLGQVHWGDLVHV